jgi:protein-serine/threonine kinase
LQTLKHPNIVRLYDVIETDKYIGIILEYASGGELFDHILAHRYLKEKDAAKLFSQLISGVWYIHQKKIVHRDLKLENLLLDRHRNVIITDFGFANRFEHRSDDLMQTSCGSPCYAAPELVISEGLYVGSAVDIWSCGVILYAMLAGYLPFDDDPANPDGDNINLLYKYIVNTPLSVPDYVSLEARDLLSIMLVPDPTQRADLRSIMSHEWLAPYAHVFVKGVDELERAAMEQHQMKRLAYQRQMKQAAAAAAEANNKVVRTQSARPDVFAGSSSTATRNQSYKNQQPEYLYETSVDQSTNSSHLPPVIPPGTRRGNSAIVIPTASPLDDDPFAPSPSHDIANSSIPIHVSAVGEPETRGHSESRQRKNSRDKGPPPAASSKVPPEAAKKKGAFRHTIQVEYGDPDTQDTPPTPSQSPPKAVPVTKKQVPDVGPKPKEERPSRARTVSHESPSATRKKPSGDESANSKPLPSAPAPTTRKTPERAITPTPDAIATVDKNGPAVSIATPTPPTTPFSSEPDKSMQAQVKRGTESTGSRSSKQSGRHKRGLSVDKLGFGKIFGSAPSVEQVQVNGVTSRVPSEGSAAESGDRQSSNGPTASSDASLTNSAEPATTKKSRRNTLTVMVEPFRQTLKGKKKVVVAETPVKEKPPAPLSAMQAPATPNFVNASKTSISFGMGIPGSTNKANTVMQWFRTKSKGRADRPPTFTDEPAGDISTEQEKELVPPTPTQASYKAAAASSTTTINQDKGRSPRSGPPHRTASTGTDASFSTLADRVRRSVGVAAPTPAKGVLRVHHGAVDHSTITTKPPPEVMKHVREVLEGMGMDIRLENEFKYRCIRLKRKKTGASVGLGLRDIGSGNGLAAFNMVGSAASNGVRSP